MQNQLADIEVSVSHTTRARREGEIDGVNYHFIDKKSFQKMLAAGEFFESATVFGNMYGTASEQIRQQLQTGKDVILEIDWQGARQVRKLAEDCRSIYILPPSVSALRERLTSRGQDDEAIISGRMREAVSEMSHYVEFDYLIINDDFDKAKDDLASIITGERMLMTRQAQQHKGLLAELLALS